MNTPIAPSAPSRPSVIQLAIKEKGALYAAYIPLFAEGGIFIPTAREYRLGDDVYVLLTLPDDPQRYPVAGKVAWITPARSAGNQSGAVKQFGTGQGSIRRKVLQYGHRNMLVDLPLPRQTPKMTAATSQPRRP